MACNCACIGKEGLCAHQRACTIVSRSTIEHTYCTASQRSQTFFSNKDIFLSFLTLFPKTLSGSQDFISSCKLADAWLHHVWRKKFLSLPILIEHPPPSTHLFIVFSHATPYLYSLFFPHCLQMRCGHSSKKTHYNSSF